MALTREELAARRHYVGGSDVPAILGVSPYRNITDVWLEKTGRMDPDRTTSRPADLGNRLERPLVELVADQLGERVEFGHRFTRDDAEYKVAQVDGWMPDVSAPIEAKCIGLWNSRFDARDWGSEGTDQVPYYVLVQVVWQLHCSDSVEGYVSALLGGGLGHRVYHIKAVPGLAREIDDRVDRFWHENVLADIEPSMPASLSSYRDVLREPGKVVEVDDALPFAYEAAQVAATDAKKELDRVRQLALQQMGDAETGYTPWGHFTYKANVRGVRTFRLHAGGK